MNISATPAHPFPDVPSFVIPRVRIRTNGSLAERPDDDFLTLPEVAASLSTPVNTRRGWRQQGTGPRFFKIGRELVTTVGDLTTWIEDQKRTSGPGAA